MSRIRQIDTGDRQMLLPQMEEGTDVSFGLVARRLGADAVYTEFRSSETLIRTAAKSSKKKVTFTEARPLAIQRFGGPDRGGWVNHVAKNGAGAALLRCVLVSLAVVLLLGDAASAQTAQLRQLGLQGKLVRDLSECDSVLYAACGLSGVYSYDLRQGFDGDWASQGLAGWFCVTVHCQPSTIWSGRELLVGAQPSGTKEAMVWRYTDEGWAEYDQHINKSGYLFKIRAVGGTQLLPPTFFMSNSQLQTRNLGSDAWYFDNRIPVLLDLDVSQETGEIAVAGGDITNMPVVYSSTDRGSSWSMSSFPGEQSQIPTSIRVFTPVPTEAWPERNVSGLGTMRNGIAIRIDSGSSETGTWQQATDAEIPYLFTSVVQDGADRRHFVSFATREPGFDTTIAYESWDNGISWHGVELSRPGLTPVYTTLGSKTKGRIYIGTKSDGVWVYESTAPSSSVRYKSVTESQLRFDLSQRAIILEDASKTVEIDVFNVLGQKVLSLSARHGIAYIPASLLPGFYQAVVPGVGALKLTIGEK